MSQTETYRTAGEAERGLGELYRRYGYRHYKMSKFEEYDFYARNKNFLVSSNIITFTNPDGRLMALKPDVTLSIVKNARWKPGDAEKVYYTEKVYRAENGAHEYREISQTGLECVGDLGAYDAAEVVLLALKSLAGISGDYVLNLSHLGLVSALTAPLGLQEAEQTALLAAIGEKNVPALRALCEKNGVSAQNTERLTALTSLYGTFPATKEALQRLNCNEEADRAIKELTALYEMLDSEHLAEKIRLDFSLMNDMRYYNGLIFRGYINGIPQGILSGGSYDRLLTEMGKSANAIGFAIYLDLLEHLPRSEKREKTDILLSYDTQVPAATVLREAERYRRAGLSVRVQKTDDGTAPAQKRVHLGERTD